MDQSAKNDQMNDKVTARKSTWGRECLFNNSKQGWVTISEYYC